MSREPMSPEQDTRLNRAIEHDALDSQPTPEQIAERLTDEDAEAILEEWLGVNGSDE